MSGSSHSLLAPAACANRRKPRAAVSDLFVFAGCAFLRHARDALERAAPEWPQSPYLQLSSHDRTTPEAPGRSAWRRKESPVHETRFETMNSAPLSLAMSG